MNKLPIIKKGYHAGMDFKSETQGGSLFGLYIFFGIIILFFLVLSLRLFQLTVVKGEYYRRVAEENRIREVIIEAKRGTIIDRKGVIMAQNADADLHAPGPRLFSTRRYIDAEASGPIIGYRQNADTNDIKNDSCLNKIELGDKVGKKGVEKIYDCDLRGQNGKKLIEVDAKGNPIKTLSIIPPEDGKTIQLSIDANLQNKAYELLKGRKGVVVALKPQTGEVLALVSSPTYNPQDFEDLQNDKIRSYLQDKDKPLFNRATEGTYPPGSVFKLTVATGAMEDKKVDESFEIEDTGRIKAGPLEFGNWYFLEYGKTEGMVNMVKAIQRSNDIYFYRVGEKLGDLGIKSWAEKFGYGKKTGILLDESEGTVPSEFWKEEVLKEQWYLGDTYNYSIGQGYLLVTPLQVAQATTAIANNGYLCNPKLLKTKDPNCRKLNLSPHTLDIIHQGMKAACSPGGTGWPLFNFSVKSSDLKQSDQVKVSTDSASMAGRQLIPIACKTGTAESSTAGSATPHAWFTAYAPADNPEIQITVLVEESGQGSDIGGPVARDMFTAYFERKE